MKYNAFISYKHAPLDMEIAKKVHTGLETYKVPKAVRIKTGKKKIERVFRDQEELPIGSNLSDNISDALRESEFLVVICSPRTPKSYWVQKEIEAFIGMHGRDHVLAVLVEGEPDESFPKALTVDEEGNPVEPLAADVRGENKKERNTKFKTEILRLIAPILGCTYDDLRQRHKERIIKRTIALVSSAASVIAVAGAAFGIYNANVADKMSKLADEKAALAEEKTELADEILKEFTAKQENQSRFYAKEALSLLEEGERQDAALVAMAGLPSENGDRPYVADAEYALGRVLHAYDLGYDMAFDRTLTHNLTVYDEKLSEDMKHLVTKDSGYSVYVWDTETWELLTRIDPGLNERNYLESITEYDVDEDGVYITGDHTFSKYDFEGKCVYTYESEDYLTTSQIVSAGNEALLVTDGRIDIINLKTGEFIESVDTGDIDLGSKKRLSKDGGYMAFPANDDEVHSSRIVIYNTESKQFVLGNTSDGYIMDTWFTQSGNVAVISCNGDFLGGDVTSVHLDVINAETGRTVASAKVPANVRYSATFDAAVRAHTYQVDDEVHAEVVLAIESEAFTYNELSGELISRVTLPGEMVTLDVRKDNAIGFVGYDNGKIDTFDFYEGRIYSDNTIDTKLPIRDVCIMNGKIAVRAAYTSNVYVMKYHSASDLETIVEAKQYSFVHCAPDSKDRFLTGSSGQYLMYDSEGNTVYTFETEEEYDIVTGIYKDKYVIVTPEHLYVADGEKKETETINLSDLGLTSKIWKGSFSSNSRYALLWDSRYFALLDLETGSCVVESGTNGRILDMVPSDDGKFIYVSFAEANLVRYDIANDEAFEFEDEALHGLSDYTGLQYMCLNHAGDRLALCCPDGNLRIVDTADGSVKDVLTMYTKSRCFLMFTEDDRNLIMQGDDYKLKIWDTEEGTYKTSFDASYTVRFAIKDSNGKIALCDGVNVYLLDSADYALCAVADYGQTYLPGEKSFVMNRGKAVFKSKYKDYKALIDEAKAQFPEAELTDEKRVKYNVG